MAQRKLFGFSWTMHGGDSFFKSFSLTEKYDGSLGTWALNFYSCENNFFLNNHIRNNSFPNNNWVRRHYYAAMKPEYFCFSRSKSIYIIFTSTMLNALPSANDVYFVYFIYLSFLLKEKKLSGWIIYSISI